MPQLIQNRYFKHKYFKDVVIRSVMRKQDASAQGEAGFYHLYIELVSGRELIGMSGNQSFMLSTARHEGSWQEALEKWTRENQYVDHYPKQFTQQEAAEFIQQCAAEKAHGQRLGQAIINKLGDDTPTPNIAIFSSTDEAKVTEWFYEKHVADGLGA